MAKSNYSRLKQFIWTSYDVLSVLVILLTFDKILKNNLYIELRELVIKDKYDMLIRNGKSGTRAFLELSAEYGLAEPTIKFIIYGK